MSVTVESVSQLRNLLKDYRHGDKPVTLPAVFYTSEDWLKEEIEQLLRREWHCLGRAEEVRKPGEYFTMELLGEPLLIVRGKDFRIRVLSNVCRHRNMPVADGAGVARNFVCPYHAWSYRLDGSLLRAPYMDETTATDCRLPEIRSEIWQGFIYANLDPHAQPLAPRLSGLDQILMNYHSDKMHHVFVEEDVWPANWKCLLENFMEGYHLSRVHPKTLGGRTPTELCEKLPSAKDYSAYRAHYPPTAPARGRGHPDLTEIEKKCSTLFSVYPAQVASQAMDILVYMALQPQGVDRVKIRWGVSVYDQELDQKEIDDRIDLWRRINAEDKLKLEKLQGALRSSYATAGPLAPDHLEGTIQDFHGYLGRRLGATENTTTAPASKISGDPVASQTVLD